MNRSLQHIKTEVYDKCSLHFSNLNIEEESREYKACQFQLNGLSIMFRKAKKTPKKKGQFVCFWKRNEKKIIEPFNEHDAIDFLVVNVEDHHKIGQFVFPKNLLIEKGIISTKAKEGKRAFRVYPIWDTVNSIQANRTQIWQLRYFYMLSESTDLQKVKELYHQ